MGVVFEARKAKVADPMYCDFILVNFWKRRLSGAAVHAGDELSREGMVSTIAVEVNVVPIHPNSLEAIPNELIAEL